MTTKKESPSQQGPDDAGTSTKEDIKNTENNFSTPHSKDDLTENERIILGQDAHKDDYSDQDLFDEKGKPVVL